MCRVFNNINVAVLGLLVSVLAVSCEKVYPVDPVLPSRYDQVLLMYSAGYNSLSGDLEDDVNDMKRGYLPSKTDPDRKSVV